MKTSSHWERSQDASSLKDFCQRQHFRWQAGKETSLLSHRRVGGGKLIGGLTPSTTGGQDCKSEKRLQDSIHARASAAGETTLLMTWHAFSFWRVGRGKSRTVTTRRMTRREEENFSRHHREWDSSGAQHTNAPVAAHIRGWHCTSGSNAPVAELEWSWWWQKLLLEVANRLFESSCCLSLVGKTLVVIKEGGDKNWGGIKTKGGSLGFSQEPKQRFNCVWEEKCENLESTLAPLTLARYRVRKCVL